MSDSAVFIDVRGPGEYGVSHVSGAINIPLGQIELGNPEVAGLDKSASVVVYCGAGGRAEQAKRKLENLGFSNVTNGINQREVEAKYL